MADRDSGFTLPEVLIALAIVVIAFLAMYGSAQQIVFATTLQQEKTFATWVAQNQLTELRLATGLPDGDRIADSVEMAGLEWRYVIELEESPVASLALANISVSLEDEPDTIITKLQAAVPLSSPAGVVGLGGSGGPPVGGGSRRGNSGSALSTSEMAVGDGTGSNLIDSDGDGIPDSLVDDPTGDES